MFSQLEKSHMPFFAPVAENVYRDFCCIPVKGVWKIHQNIDGKWKKVNTYMDDRATECAPVATYYDDCCHLSFIAEDYSADKLFKLYHICDIDSNQQPIEICPARVGFSKPYFTTYGSHRGPIHIEKLSGHTTITCKDLEFLYRLSFDPFDPYRLLISGQTYDMDLVSRLYDLRNNKLYDIIADGNVAYKLALRGDDVYYAKKYGDHFEDRRILKARNVEYVKVSNDLIDVIVEQEPARLAELEEDFE